MTDTTAVTVDYLSPEADGLWLVETQGSEHLWDMDKFTYVRMNNSGDNPFYFDGQECQINPETVIWPRVGGVFALIQANGQYHRSSRIKSITKVPRAERHEAF